MNVAPRLSIGLPVYNGETYLIESLDSLLSQSYEDFELIISDNASTDGTGDICRRYAKQDPRIHFIRQPRNIGLALNHNFVFQEARGELFKWASHDDLYARDLLQRCVDALDENPHTVLAHSSTAIIDESGSVVKLFEYLLDTASLRVPERFRSMLFAYGGDDGYGVVRAKVLRRTALHGSYHHAYRTITAELALHGPFHHVPDWLYFRRDHPEREERACPTLRTRCANMDPRRADRLRHPAVRLYGECTMVDKPGSPSARLAGPEVGFQGAINHRGRYCGGRPGEKAFVTLREFTGRRQRSTAAGPQVGLFGLIGTSNIGNEGMLEAVVNWLRTDHPDAIIDFVCTGPERVKARYGAAAIPLNWYQKHERASGPAAIVLKALGKGFDAFRVASWVRKHDVVIVPGAGVLEATLPMGPWWCPYAMFLASASGRTFGTKVAMVSVGSSVLSRGLTRWFITSAARLAFYRSYRDTGSYDAMRRAGIDVTQDHVYPDLAFALPIPPTGPSDPLTVGVGVMAYHGTNDDRKLADEIHASYMEKMKRFVQWLADSGHRIRLFGGDNLWDDSVVEEILADLRAHRPDLEPTCAVAEPVTSLEELMQEMGPVGLLWQGCLKAAS